MKNSDIPYWIALSQLPRWGTEKVNKLITRILIDNRATIEEFFSFSQPKWREEFELSNNDIQDIEQSKSELPNYSFLTENLFAQGYEIITLNSPDYSETLKDNLKLKNSPTLLYIKGNKKILKEKSIAIVGCRDANQTSLQFTDNVAKKAAEYFKVVVSGFAKGVDKQALDSSLAYIGHSIIVLPQGIMTFASGMNKYYKQIIQGDVLVLSTFFPKAPWSIGLAMARNPVIYGLADEIYVAQSNNSGGTWTGVIDGFKKNRQIYVRYPGSNEECANLELIRIGGIPVDINGDILLNDINIEYKKSDDNIINLIYSALGNKELGSKQVIDTINVDWSPRQMTNYLKNDPKIEVINSKPHKFKLKNQDSLF